MHRLIGVLISRKNMKKIILAAIMIAIISLTLFGCVAQNHLLFVDDMCIITTTTGTTTNDATQQEVDNDNNVHDIVTRPNNTLAPSVSDSESDVHQHSYQIDIVMPTCTDGGYTVYACECGCADIGDRTEPLNHMLGDYIIDRHPTCNNPGLENASCVRCEYCEVREIEATGHVVGEWTIYIEAKCEENGILRRFCLNCDYFEDMSVNAYEHSYEAVITRPTCTENGYTTNKCKRCESQYIDNYKNAIGHDWSAWKVVKESTYEAEGVELRTCVVCNKNESKSIAKLKKPIKYIDLNNYQEVVSFNGLTDEEVAIVKALLQECANYKSENVDRIYVTIDRPISYDSYMKIASFFAIYTANYNKQWQLVTVCNNSTTKTASVWLDKELFEELMEEKALLDAELETVLSSFTEGSEEHKLRQIADWLRETFVYESGALDGYKALQTKKANCNGFAFLFQVMASRLGIQCDICVGYTNDGGKHAWNRVTLESCETRFYDISFYNSNGRTKYLYAKESPWSDYIINNYDY